MGYPIELDLRARTVLVVGLGSVGKRKVVGLLAAGARVVAVDPAASTDDLPAGPVLRAEPYHPDHLNGVSLVVTAASPAVNARVVADAQRVGLWVSSASDPESSDFIVPAIWREGPLTVTVSTSGASPALAATVRDRLAQLLGPETAALAALLAALRPVVMARVADPDARRRLLAGWGNAHWLELWLESGPEAVRDALLAEIERAAANPPDPHAR